jgi:cell division protein FtsI (penicillin-binding protein 3)
MASVYADPKQILNIHEAAVKLAPLLGETPKALQAKLSKPGVRFLWLKRDITPREEYAINRLGIPGVDFRYEERRIYPMDNLAAHLVGYTDRDGNGIAGMEKSYDDQLSAGDAPVQLAIDSRVQHIVRREVMNAVDKFSAIGGIGMMMNVKTGEIVAMVSEPDFNPNTPGVTSGTGDNDPKFNRAALGVYEMGSTFKSLTIAEALDSGRVKMFDEFDARQPIHVGKFKIDDFHPEYKIMDVPHVFIFSSNIGTVKIVEKLGTDLFKSFLARVGMMKPAPIELPEIGRPIVPNPWQEISTMTIAFGHGMSVSPAQLLRAESAMVNGGVLVTPTLLKQPPTTTPKGEQVIKPETSLAMRRLLRLNVLAGTGKKGAVPGYVVGGKTGTTEKAINGVYAKKRLISSFIAAFPMDDPQYVVLVMVDEPKPRKDTFGYATGGWVAAPPVANIIAGAAPILGVAPRDENAPDIVQKLTIPGLDYARVIEEGKEH